MPLAFLCDFQSAWTSKNESVAAVGAGIQEIIPEIIRHSKYHFRNQTDKLLNSKTYSRNQTDKFWKSKIRFRNQAQKTRIKTYNYFSDTPGTPHLSLRFPKHFLTI